MFLCIFFNRDAVFIEVGVCGLDFFFYDCVGVNFVNLCFFGFFFGFFIFDLFFFDFIRGLVLFVKYGFGLKVVFFSRLILKIFVLI